jgi:hypothetical protein
MLKLTSLSQLSRIPPPYRPPVKNALQNLPPTDGPDPSDRGFVVFVEENDTLEDINHACHRDISTSLEGTFLDGNCLIGVVLWGNSGDGVTIVCPDQKGYADEITEVLRKHL